LMKRKVLISMLAVSVLAIAAVSGVLLYRTVSAAAATPNPLPGDQTGRGGPGRGFDGGVSNEQLASALGITVDQLTAAYQKANDAALVQAVADGLITQAQADQLKTNGEAFPFGGRWMGWLKQQGVDYDALLAQALGITTDQLQAAYTKAADARIDQAVTDGKLTQEQADLMKAQRALFVNQSFKSAIQAAFEAAVKQAVTGGVITQAQADLILQAASQKGDGMSGPFMGGPFMGGPGGDGRGHGGFGGGPAFGQPGSGPDNGGQPANPAPSAPAVTPSSSGL
jgi:hypothetical protein